MFKSIGYNGQVQCVREKICAEWEKETWLSFNSGFGELLGTRRNVYVFVDAAKCMHATAI